MNRPSPFNEKQACLLETFLADSRRPKGTMTYPQAAGFLFSVTCAPEMVRPSEWLPFIFNEEDPEFTSEKQAEQVVGALMNLYNWVNGGVVDGAPELPPRVQLAADPMDNFMETSSLGGWAKGFVSGYLWLEDDWDRQFPDEDENHECEMSQELGACLAVLGFFSNRKMAKKLISESRVEGEKGKKGARPRPFKEDAAMMQEMFPRAMVSYASIRGELAETSLAGDPSPERPPSGPSVGRNHPCPCGSGKKHKKCCGKA